MKITKEFLTKTSGTAAVRVFTLCRLLKRCIAVSLIDRTSMVPQLILVSHEKTRKIKFIRIERSHLTFEFFICSARTINAGALSLSVFSRGVLYGNALTGTFT
jgi:hypothetical protein